MHRAWLFLLSVTLAAGCGDSEDDGAEATTGTSSTTDESTSSGSSSSTTDDSTTTSTGSSTGEPETSGSSSGGEPEYYTQCTENEQCETPLICNTLAGFCSAPCEAADECPAPATGDATPTCSMTTTTCILSCFDGETCPDGMNCEGNDEVAFCLFL